jgi:DNA-binding MarR family transcriptional regulator
MAGETPWYEDVAIPALLRHARRVYGTAIRSAQVAVGCDDVPRNGSYVLGSIARSGSPLADIIQQMGMSKQAAGQLVDTLVVRGYLDRTPDPNDRRRMTVSLTDRGRLAASAGRGAVEDLDAELLKRVGEQHVRHTQATLAAILALADEAEEG